MCVVEGLDIRGVIRRRAHGGYRYRGLYRIADFWMMVGVEGFQVCQFELLKVSSEGPVPLPPMKGAGEENGGELEVGAAETALERNIRRLIAAREVVARDPAVVSRVKEMYDDTCQICGVRLVISQEGKAFSNCAHIQALGRPFSLEVS